MQNLKDINWNHLYGFYEVARAQSLKRAACLLKLAPSTLSEQIKKLEETFDRVLFIRSSKGLSLTQEGLALYEHSRIIFEEGSRVLEKFSENTLGGYPINIGIEETISYDLATEFASQYWDLYAPFGTINTLRQIDHNTLVDNLIRQNIDWGISLRRPKHKSLEYAAIGSFEIVFCCSEELYHKFKKTSDLLINIPFAENSWDKNLNQTIYQHLRKHGITPKEKIFSDHTDFVKKLCARGRCIMFTAKNPLESYSGLKTFCLDEPLEITLFALWKKSNQGLIAIKKLNELIMSKLSEVPKRYKDVELQIEVSEVAKDLLNKKD